MSITTLLPQWATSPNPPLALQCFNGTGSKIAAGLFVAMDPSNVVESGLDAAGNPITGVGVKLPATGVTPVAGHLGVTLQSIDLQQIGPVATSGIVPVVARGSITAGTYVSASSTVGTVGRAQAIASGDICGGLCLNTVADGDTAIVLLAPAGGWIHA